MALCEHSKVKSKCNECLAQQQAGAVIAPQKQGQPEGEGVVSTSLEVVGDVTMTEAGGMGV
jgi:hypothetical protein